MPWSWEETPSWCPACAKVLVQPTPNQEPHCPRHGYVVAKIYRCGCGRREEFRAIDNVPTWAHYCGSCTETLTPDVRAHLEPVVAISTPTTGPWRPA